MRGESRAPQPLVVAVTCRLHRIPCSAAPYARRLHVGHIGSRAPQALRADLYEDPAAAWSDADTLALIEALEIYEDKWEDVGHESVQPTAFRFAWNRTVDAPNATAGRGLQLSYGRERTAPITPATGGGARGEAGGAVRAPANPNPNPNPNPDRWRRTWVGRWSSACTSFCASLSRNLTSTPSTANAEGSEPPPTRSGVRTQPHRHLS